MKRIISLVDVINCNGYLKEHNLNFRIHIRDACGKQSCWIEPLSDCACDGTYEELYPLLEVFFEKLGFSLEFSEDKLNFWLEQDL